MSQTFNISLFDRVINLAIYDPNTVEAARQAGIATDKAIEAAASVIEAEVKVAEASDFADLSAAAALTLDNVFVDTAAGLAAVSNGQYFWTPSPLTFWLKSGGLAVQKAQIVTNAQLDLKVNKSDISRNVLDSVSFDAAVAAAASGDTIFIPDNTRIPPLSAPLTKSLKIIGARKPSLKSNLSRLEKGSVICGPLIYDADNLEFHNIGVDSGSDACAQFHGGVAQEGLVCTVTYATADHVGLRVGNVIAMVKGRDVNVHAFAAERQIKPIINGVETVYGLHGQAYKVVRGEISNLISSRSGGEGVIIKRDESSACYESNFTNITIDCYDGAERGDYGIILESRRGDDAVTPGNLYGINITNLTVSGALLDGIYAVGAQTNTDAVADITITNATLIDCGKDGYSATGNTIGITLISVRALNSGQFGFTDAQTGVASRSIDTKMLGCTARGCNSGFVGQGRRFETVACTSSDNDNYGFYAKDGSSSYRQGNRGSGNGTNLYGSDSNAYWFELGMPYQEQLISPTLLNSWSALDPTGVSHGVPKIWVGSDGMVRASGVVQGGAIGSIVFVFPPGMRPSANERFSSPVPGATSVTDTNVTANGEFSVVAGINTYVSLNSISFLPDRGD